MSTNLTLYCSPRYLEYKSVLFCLLKCQYKNRCRDFVRHYMVNQTEIDAALAQYNEEKDREKRELMLQVPAASRPSRKRVPPRPAPEMAAEKPSAPRARTAVRQTKPAVAKKVAADIKKSATEPVKAVAPVSEQPQVKPSAPPRKNQIRPPKTIKSAQANPLPSSSKPTRKAKLPRRRNKAVSLKPPVATVDGQVYLLIEEGSNRAWSFSDEAALVRHLSSHRPTRARYYRAVEMHPTLRLIEKRD